MYHPSSSDLSCTFLGLSCFSFKRYCGTCSTFFYKNIHASTCACVLRVGPSRLILGTMVPSLLVRLLWFLSRLGFLWPIIGLSFLLDPSALLGAVFQRGGLVHMGTVTLLRALRPDVGGWVTLSPRYWAGR